MKFKLVSSPLPVVGSVAVTSINPSPFSDLTQVTLSLRTYFNQDIQLPLYVPKPLTPDFGPINFDEVETECLGWAKEKGLYEGNLFKILEKTHVALLSAVTYPGMPREGIVLITKWLMALFAINDWVDEDHAKPVSTEEIEQNVTRKMAIIHSLGDGADLATAITDKDTPITKALSELFSELAKYIDHHKGSLLDFTGSLEHYFSSIIVEKRYEESGEFPSLDFSADLRADSSGAVHAIYAGMIMQGAHPVNLEKQFSELRYMRQVVAKCVEYSNDILSHYKEFLKLLRITAPDGNALTQAHQHPQLNFIHIKWHEGPANFLNLEKSYQETATHHNKLVRDFFILKKTLLEKLDQESGSEKNDAIKYIQALDGCLSQSILNIMAERYNVGGPVCTQASLTKLIESLQKQSL